MLTIRKYSSIHAVDPEQWDSILSCEDIFHTYRFISLVEDSRVEQSEFYYLLFYEEGRLVATTALTVFDINLGLFISSSRLVRQMERVFPKLFKIRVLVCGLPASFGQQNIKVREDKYAAEVCSLLAAEMRELAKELNIKFMTIKEFKDCEASLFSHFSQHGFFTAYSIPYMKMKICWHSFNDYLASLRHHYRRRIVLSLKKLGHVKPVILLPQEYESSNPLPAWVLTEPDEKFAEDFYRKYLEVMERAGTKLETLNQDFFENLFLQKQEYKILNLVVRGKTISSAILAPAGNTLTFMLLGRENERDEYDSYFNLLYGIIGFAIENGYQWVNLGQTAYWVKQCLGAQAEKEYLWFASRSRFWHWVLKRARCYVFPETKLKELRVFKAAAGNLEVATLRKEEKLIVQLRP